jgi:hypothetical protein
MLLTAIFHILTKREPYNPELYKQVNFIPVSREISVEQAILFAQKHGFSVITD